MENIEEIKKISNSSLENFRVEKLKEAYSAAVILAKLNPEYRNTPIPDKIDLKFVFRYYKAISAYSFISNYGRGYSIYSIDLESIIKTLQRIEKDPRVYFFDKFMALQAISLYCDLAIQLDFLNKVCYSVFERGREGNWVYAIVQKAIQYESKSPSKKFNEQLEDMKNKEFFKPLRELMENLLTSLSKEFDINQEDLKSELSNLITGDLRLIEKNIFPILYKTLVINKDIEKMNATAEMVAKPSPTKSDLLFDIFPLIMPNKHYQAQKDIEKDGSKYEGNYSNYRIATTKTIIGQ